LKQNRGFRIVRDIRIVGSSHWNHNFIIIFSRRDQTHCGWSTKNNQALKLHLTETLFPERENIIYIIVNIIIADFLGHFKISCIQRSRTSNLKIIFRSAALTTLGKALKFISENDIIEKSWNFLLITPNLERLSLPFFPTLSSLTWTKAENSKVITEQFRRSFSWLFKMKVLETSAIRILQAVFEQFHINGSTKVETKKRILTSWIWFECYFHSESIACIWNSILNKSSILARLKPEGNIGQFSSLIIFRLLIAKSIRLANWILLINPL